MIDNYYYRLDENKNVIPCKSLEEWARFMEDVDNRRVALDTMDKFQISTVFLGASHIIGDGTRNIFETLVFYKDANTEWEVVEEFPMWRYDTWDEAVEGHKKAIELVKTATAGKRD